MHTDDIRLSPWLLTIRLKGLLLIFACVGIGVLIGRMTSEKIVVTQDRLPTAAELAALQTSSPSSTVGRATTPEPVQRSRPVTQEEAPKKVTPPPVIVINPGAANAREAGRPAGMIGGRQKDRPPVVESHEGGGSQPPARDYRSLRDYMLNR
jgi:hypothetical protein